MAKLTLISIASAEAQGILHSEHTLDLLPGGYLDDVETILYNDNSDEVRSFEELDMIFTGEHGEDARYRIFLEHTNLPVQCTSFPKTFEDFCLLKSLTEGNIFVLEINAGIGKNAFFLVA